MTVTDEITPLVVRSAMGGFATGVAVVTAAQEGVPHGMTVNSLTSVSLEPPLLLVCLTRGARTETAIRASGAFCINILNERQEDASRRFARPGEEHFDGLELETTPLLRLPAIARALVRVECEVHGLHDGGDHAIVVGRIVSCQYRDGLPLLFYRGKYHQLGTVGSDADWYW